MTRIKLIVIISVVLALVAALFILNLTTTPQSTLPIQSPGKENIPAPKTHEQPPLKPEALKKTEIPPEEKGPFPVDDTVPEKERQTGRLFNIWRKAVLTKNITQINQLDSQIRSAGDEAIPFLTKLAKEDTNERVRAFAVRILGRQNKTDLLGLFMELLRNDTSAFVRENSAWSLGRLKNTDTLEILQKAADSDQSEAVRKIAAEAIENIRPSK
ncbi:MAG: HEAT repeat domain-containing protein [Planctomycetes bacterium]|nr:HEAT repeat domain-containing protein [Planctomycetota bacterium]